MPKSSALLLSQVVPFLDDARSQSSFRAASRTCAEAFVVAAVRREVSFGCVARPAVNVSSRNISSGPVITPASCSITDVCPVSPRCLKGDAGRALCAVVLSDAPTDRCSESTTGDVAEITVSNDALFVDVSGFSRYEGRLILQLAGRNGQPRTQTAQKLSGIAKFRRTLKSETDRRVSANTSSLVSLSSLGVARPATVPAMHVTLGCQPWAQPVKGNMVLAVLAPMMVAVDLAGLSLLSTINDGFLANVPNLRRVSFGRSMWEHLVTVGDRFMAHCPRLVEIEGLGQLRSTRTIGRDFLAGSESVEVLDFGSEDWPLITTIGINMCAQCTTLNEVRGLAALRNVVDIGDGMFSKCSALVSIDFGCDPWMFLRTVGRSAFYRCTSLETVANIASLRAVLSIGSNFMRDVKLVQVIDFGAEMWQNLRELGEFFLGWCTGLRHIKNLPSLRAVAQVGCKFCHQCDALVEVDFGSHRWTNLKTTRSNILQSAWKDRTRNVGSISTASAAHAGA